MRVTGVGVEVVVEGCSRLEAFDVSQCKNLVPWLRTGGGRKYGDKLRTDTVLKGTKLSR